MATYPIPPKPFVHLTVEINSAMTDENLMRRHITLETWDELDSRIQEEIEWYGKKQGYCLRWRAYSGNGAYDTERRSGEWGYEALASRAAHKEARP